jgi:hypothetical protein
MASCWKEKLTEDRLTEKHLWGDLLSIIWHFQWGVLHIQHLVLISSWMTMMTTRVQRRARAMTLGQGRAQARVAVRMLSWIPLILLPTFVFTTNGVTTAHWPPPL